MNEFKKTTVQELMMRDVRTISPGALLSLAANMMLESDITCLVVDLEDTTTCMGILTQKDIIGLLFDDLVDFETTTVEEVMTHPTVALSSTWNLETAVALMRMMGVRRAPVVDGGRLVGLLSFTDVFRHMLEKRAAATP